MNENPSPEDWHRKPPGKSRSKCPICGYPPTLSGEHRRKENPPYHWERRKKSPKGWIVTPHGSPRTGYRHQKVRIGGMTERIRRTIGKAVALKAQGYMMKEVAAKLGMPLHRLENLRTDHVEFWQAVEDKAAKDLVDVIRAVAGTDAVKQNIDQYLKMADHAQAWCDRHGVELFPSNGKPTVTSFYRDYVVPNCMVNPSRGHLLQYEISLKRWALLTADPPLEKITSALLCAYRDANAGARGQKAESTASPVTVNCRLKHVQRILDKAGPPGRGNRDAAGILDKVPWARPYRVPAPMVKIVPLDLINRVYQAAGQMDTPTIPGVNPGKFWQCIVVLVWNTGIRRRTLLELRWDEVDWANHCLRLPPERLKANRGELIHLTDVVIEHLRRIQGDRELVFEWPHGARYFNHRWTRVLDLAGIPFPERFTLKDIRKTLATRLCEVSASAAQLALTHSTFAVTKRHYVQSSGIVARALDALPQPESFTSG